MSRVRLPGVRARHFFGAVLFDRGGCLAPTAAELEYDHRLN